MTKKMPNLSLFVAKLEKINENESLKNISAPQNTFMPHRPIKTGFNHIIHWCKVPEIKKKYAKRPQKDLNMRNLSLFVEQ